MKSVVEWLEQTARRLPDKVAVAGIDDELTFSELRLCAQAAGAWIASEVAPRIPVAIFAEKSPACLAAMLGAAYARCPYSVIDVRQPADRIERIAAKLAPGAVLASAAELDRAQGIFANAGILVLSFDEAFAKGAAAREAGSDALGARLAQALDTDPLYINFTSGSTGQPKGVAVAHRSVVDFIPQFTALFGIGEADRIGNQAPFDFDVSVKDIYSCLFTAASMHLIPRDYFSQPALLMDFLADRAITTCTWAVSAMCFVSIMGGFDYRVPTSINKVIFSGEVMPPKQLAKWRRALPEAMFVNVYGPTEVTCNCTYHVVERDYAKDEVIPAGKPFPNEGVFLLDEDDALVREPGHEGEVCVAGTCLALGYYNDTERTAESFVRNPLNPAFPETMYRTGDLAFWDEEGRLVYSGRKDHQIKHMGQRIELGEIEAAAQALDYVERACCIYDAKRKKINLFYVAAEGLSAESPDSRRSQKEARSAAEAASVEAADSGNSRKASAESSDSEQSQKADFDAELIADLSARLPHYMVPGKVARLDVMPVTKNGKIDRHALEQAGGIRK